MGKRIAIIQSNYIPWKGYFDLINSVDDFVIYDIVQYTKNDWRNRNKLMIMNKEKWLTIPVAQNKLKQSINETKIINNRWINTHWKTIQQNYSQCAGFELYSEIIYEAYQSLFNEYFLSNINIHFIKIINSILGIKTTLHNASDFNLPIHRVDRLISLCKKLNATEYLTGPLAKNYLNESTFKQHGIAIHWINYEGYSPYPQQSYQFSHHVSILDLLFNAGSDFKKYMKSF